MATGPYLPALPSAGTVISTGTFGDPVVRALNYYQGTPASGDDIRPYFVAYQTVAQALTSGASAGVLFDSELIDTANGHSTTVNTSQWGCPTGKQGWYEGSYQAGFATNSTGDRAAWIEINGFFRQAYNIAAAASTHQTYLSGADRFYLNAGDIVTLKVEQYSGGPLNTDTASAQCRLTLAQELMQ